MLRQTERLAAPPMTGGGLWRRWVVAMSLGECAGFLVPSAVGGLLFALGAPQAAMLPPMVLAGAVEGAALGFAQCTVLCGVLPGLSRRRWG